MQQLQGYVEQKTHGHNAKANGYDDLTQPGGQTGEKYGAILPLQVDEANGMPGYDATDDGTEEIVDDG